MPLSLSCMHKYVCACVLRAKLSRALRAPDCGAPPTCPPDSWAGALPGIGPCARAGSVAAGSLVGSVTRMGNVK
jgi:hypothetical protein